MKIKSILASALAMLVLAACNKDEEMTPGGEDGNSLTEVAYLSLNVLTEPVTRASGENNGSDESDLKSLYLITFDNTGKIVPAPGVNSYFIKLTNPASVMEPHKVSVKAEKLLVITNPGNKLANVINNLNATTTFATVNTAIQEVTMTEITDNTSNITKGFAMINSGDETGKSAGQIIDDPLIDISNKIKKLSEYANETEAKEAAHNDRAYVQIERLAAKLEFKVKSQLTVSPQGATFEFGNWTLDGVNTTFYPFAEKHLLSVTHNANGKYTSNFYTVDPNFTSANAGDGINTGGINQQTFEPELVAPYTWMNAAAQSYCIENTMDANEQKYGNATRIVIKGAYYPETGWSGDWFNFAGVNYKNLDALKAAYDAAATSGSNLKAACDKMFEHIKNYADAHSINLEGNTFKTLTENDLAQISNGGEVLKDGKNDVIRWYQNGLSYYYYQIRHDNEASQEMTFGKYGVVRNNWYSLTLGNVNGAGTPWYPDIENPGPGDPEPVDPIDESGGFLGVTVEVAPWIIWENEIEI